jgi:hypothetical protein
VGMPIKVNRVIIALVRAFKNHYRLRFLEIQTEANDFGGLGYQSRRKNNLYNQI